MISSRAEITTARASRYLVQLCRHAAAIGARDHRHGGGPSTAADPDGSRVRAEWTDSRGAITFASGGRAALTADTSTLTIRLDAADDATLRAAQNVLSRSLERFGAREQLHLTWRPDRGT